MTIQLSLFDPIPIVYDQVLSDNANKLVEMLNEGLKPKEHYQQYATIQINQFVVLIVVNREKDFLANVLDNYGNTPKDFCVNWRNLKIVKEEIKETLN